MRNKFEQLWPIFSFQSDKTLSRKFICRLFAFSYILSGCCYKLRLMTFYSNKNFYPILQPLFKCHFEALSLFSSSGSLLDMYLVIFHPEEQFSNCIYSSLLAHLFHNIFSKFSLFIFLCCSQQKIINGPLTSHGTNTL